MTMRIPNAEVSSIYENHIRNWFERIIKETPHKELHRAIKDKDAGAAGQLLTELLKKSISTFDSAESFYHGFLLSLLIGLPDYTARSNREAGDGRPDIGAAILMIKVKKGAGRADSPKKRLISQYSF